MVPVLQYLMYIMSLEYLEFIEHGSTHREGAQNNIENGSSEIKGMNNKIITKGRMTKNRMYPIYLQPKVVMSYKK